ncbi:Het-C-domain-containing protein, partial [Rhizodiscina lignyota]
LLILVLYARPAHAFGAGNIPDTARVEGQNWRHGDIEDTLLGLLMSARASKKFSKMDVKRVYFGNWLRDYSQAVDVGTVKYVSAEAIRLLLWVLGFMSFGYGAREFEVTRDRLGCYRPEEHIDNPKDYADNLDARQYDRRLRGPVDERRELSIDERTGLKHYIATEDIGITTSAGMVRNLYGRCIQLGREHNRTGNKDALYEALRLLGTANHCLEDYSAHSNYTELALIELGEREVFPHVGRRTQVQVRGARGPIWPIVTGTFGGVDFLHSVMGEFSDKATQSEVSELEGTINEAQINQNNTSLLKELLSQLPSGLFGGEDQAGKADELQANAAAAQMQNMHISPKQPEEWTEMLANVSKQIYPILEFHDNIMGSITETIEKIPILPDLLESLENQVNIFVFSLLAPFVVPIIKQVKNELATGSSEIIQSSRDKQLIVFNDDSCTDPTHSMLSKDHFSNVLNEPAGKVASQVLKWVVPQIVQCWDDERVDPNRTIQRIIQGVFHHPALRQYGDDGASDGRQLMFRVVEGWWREMPDQERDDLRRKLSREGVERGENHKEDVQDGGHGCGKPLGMPSFTTAASGEGGGQMNEIGKVAGEALGGGVLGSVVGGLVGGVGSSLLGGAFDKPSDEHHTYKQEGYTQDGGYRTSYTETAQHRGDPSQEQKYGQAEYSRTEYPGGTRREEYSRYEQDEAKAGRGTSGYGYSASVEQTGSSYGEGYERREEQRWERPGGEWASEDRVEGVRRSGEYYHEEKKHHGHHRRDESDEESDDDDDYEKKARKRAEKERKEREKEERKRREEAEREERREEHHHRRHDDEEGAAYQERQSSQRYSGGYNRGEGGYGGREYQQPQQSYVSREESYGGPEYRESGYGQRSLGSEREESYGGAQSYGRGESYGERNESYGEPGYERRNDEGGYGESGGYGGD